MADFADTYSIQVRGQAEIARLEQEIRDAARALQDINQPTAQFEDLARRNAQEIERWRRQLDGVNSTRATRGMTELARGLDDLQYGFVGVQNNLQQMAVNMGAGGALILGITGLTLAANYLYKNWDKVSDLFKNMFGDVSNADNFRTAVEKITKALEEAKKETEKYSKATVFTKDEAIGLIKAKERQLELEKDLTEEQRKQANVKSVLEGKSLEEREREQAIKTTISDAGGDPVNEIRSRIMESVFKSSNFEETRKSWENRQGGILEQLEKPEIRRNITLRRYFEDQQKELEKEMTLKSNEINERAVKISTDLIDKLSKGDIGAIKEIRNRIGDSDLLNEIEKTAQSSKSSTERKKESERIEKEASDKLKNETEQLQSRIQSKVDQAFLDKVRKGEAIDENAFLRPNEKGLELRKLDLEAAREQARLKAEAELSRTTLKTENEVESARSKAISDLVSRNKPFLPGIENALARGANQNLVENQIMQGLQRQNVDPSMQKDVAAKILDQAMRENQEAFNRFASIGLNQQMATVARIRELTAEMNRQTQQTRDLFNNQNQTNFRLRQNGPTFMPVFP